MASCSWGSGAGIPRSIFSADALAADVGQHNIAVNEISPGPVRTELTRGIEERARATGGETVFTNSVEWIKQPEDVAPLAVFLAAMPEPGPSAQSFCLNRRDV